MDMDGVKTNLGMNLEVKLESERVRHAFQTGK